MALVFGVLVIGLMLGAETDVKRDDEVGGGFEETVSLVTLLVELLGRGDTDLDTTTLLTGLLGIDIVLGVVEGESVDEMADAGPEGLSPAEFETDMMGIGSAKVGVAIASPQARATIELLRCVCMVVGSWLQRKERSSRIAV